MHVTDLPNYTEGDPGEPRHQCEPFRSIPDDLDMDVDDEAAMLAGDVTAILAGHPAVTLMGTDTADRIGFVKLGSDDPDALVACCGELRGLL